MAAQHDEEQRLMTAEKRTPAFELELPAPDASPVQVRQYLVAVLQRRSVEADRAREIATKWTLGTGEELREFSREIFIDIFGSEVGWSLHKDVQALARPESIRKQDRDSLAAAYSSRWYLVFYVLLGFSMMVGGVKIFQDTSVLWIMGSVWTFMIGIIVALQGIPGLITIALDRCGLRTDN